MKNDIAVSSQTVNKPIVDGTQGSVSLSNYAESSSAFARPTFYSETMAQKSSQILSVAEWFLHKESMSNKKLQKICYYAYAWFLVFFNDIESISAPLNTLCSGFEAWVHGPVCPELYSVYRSFGWNNIPAVETCPTFSNDVTDLFEQVWSTYGHFSADQLERLTHSELPWQEARKGLRADEPSINRIDDRLIIQYYSKMMNQ